MKVPTKLPLYLGFVVFILAIVVTSIKLGEKAVLFNGRISAQGDEARLSLTFSEPNIIAVNFISTREVAGADVTISFDKSNIDILPATLEGLSGYITTGGKIENSGQFTFSVVNPTDPLKTGFLATFRIMKKEKEDNGSAGLVKADFVGDRTDIYTADLQSIPANFSGVSQNGF